MAMGDCYGPHIRAFLMKYPHYSVENNFVYFYRHYREAGRSVETFDWFVDSLPVFTQMHMRMNAERGVPKNICGVWRYLPYESATCRWSCNADQSWFGFRTQIFGICA